MCYIQSVYIEMWVITNMYYTLSCASLTNLCLTDSPQLCRGVNINKYKGVFENHAFKNTSIVSKNTPWQFMRLNLCPITTLRV